MRFISVAALTLAAAVLAVFGLFWLLYGIDLMMTPMWGYNDSGPSTYLTFGAPMAIFGLFLVWSSAVVAALRLRSWFYLALSTQKLVRLVSGALSAMLAIAFLGISISVSVNEPVTGNALDLVEPYIIGGCTLTALFALSAALLLKPLLGNLNLRPGPDRSPGD